MAVRIEPPAKTAAAVVLGTFYAVHRRLPRWRPLRKASWTVLAVFWPMTAAGRAHGARRAVAICRLLDVLNPDR